MSNAGILAQRQIRRWCFFFFIFIVLVSDYSSDVGILYDHYQIWLMNQALVRCRLNWYLISLFFWTNSLTNYVLARFILYWYLINFFFDDLYNELGISTLYYQIWLMDQALVRCRLNWYLISFFFWTNSLTNYVLARFILYWYLINFFWMTCITNQALVRCTIRFG